MTDNETRDLIEEGRRIASQRDDLIAQGVNPADLVVPIAPPGPRARVREDIDREQLAQELYRHHDIEMVPHATDRWAATGLYRCKGCGTTFSIEDGLPRWNVVNRIRFRHLADISIAYHQGDHQ